MDLFASKHKTIKSHGRRHMIYPIWLIQTNYCWFNKIDTLIAIQMELWTIRRHEIGRHCALSQNKWINKSVSTAELRRNERQFHKWDDVLKWTDFVSLVRKQHFSISISIRLYSKSWAWWFARKRSKTKNENHLNEYREKTGLLIYSQKRFLFIQFQLVTVGNQTTMEIINVII